LTTLKHISPHFIQQFLTKIKIKAFSDNWYLFFKQKRHQQFKFVVIQKQNTRLVRHHPGNPHKHSEHYGYACQVFQQSIGIAMGTNCAPLLADLYSYEAEFGKKLLRDKDNKSNASVA
jgi:hypothetical protein